MIKISEYYIINPQCSTMSEAVTMPSLMMMTSRVSEESLARNTHTHARTRARVLNFFKVVSNFENNKTITRVGAFGS